jgi:hypothetical protein
MATPTFAADRLDFTRTPPRPALAPGTTQVRSLGNLASGGGWETTIVLMDLGPTSVSFRQSFFGNDGHPTSFGVQSDGNSGLVLANVVEGTVGPNGTVCFTLPDQGPSIQQGWSLLSFQATPNQLSAYAILRHAAVGGYTSETTVSFSAMQDFSARLQFDNTKGFQTQLTIVNPASNLPAQVRLTCFDTQGQMLLLDTVTVNPGQQTTVNLPDTYPDLAGKAGSLAILASTNILSITGLRINPSSGAISSVPVMDFITAINLE